METLTYCGNNKLLQKGSLRPFFIGNDYGTIPTLQHLMVKKCLR